MDSSDHIPVKPIRKRSIPEEIIREFQNLIDAGHFTPGSKLPGEREFAKMLNVSRPSLREALRTLSLLGIVENRPGSGTYLATSTANSSLEPFSIILSINKGVILEIFEARESLEGTVAELAAQRRDDADLVSMKRALKKMQSSLSDAKNYSEAELQFHQAVIEAGKNRIIADLMEKVYKLLVKSRNLVRQYLPDPQSYIVKDFHNHELIFKYIKAGDKGMARRSMVEHMQILKKMLAKNHVTTGSESL
jgi:GntR family transcriptional repressor for pyruvate dehydrogenase complex